MTLRWVETGGCHQAEEAAISRGRFQVKMDLLHATVAPATREVSYIPLCTSSTLYGCGCNWEVAMKQVSAKIVWKGTSWVALPAMHTHCLELKFFKCPVLLNVYSPPCWMSGLFIVKRRSSCSASLLSRGYACTRDAN